MRERSVEGKKRWQFSLAAENRKRLALRLLSFDCDSGEIGLSDTRSALVSGAQRRSGSSAATITIEAEWKGLRPCS